MRGGRGGNTGNGGRGGAIGDGGTSGTGGRGGSGGGDASGGGRGRQRRRKRRRQRRRERRADGDQHRLHERVDDPAAQTCTGNSHMSPPLTWTAGPTGTMSYGVALVDMSNGYVHWAIWDIPASTTTLPGNLPEDAGADNAGHGPADQPIHGDGYFGPCPSGQTHTYVFEVYALDVATLPGVSITDMPEAVRTIMMAHDLASGTLSGMSNASQ